MPNPKPKPETLYALSKPSRCYGCDQKQELDAIVNLKKKANETEVYCLDCSDLSAYGFLGKGNAKLTRLSKKYSANHFVIVKWSQLWKTYERQGILVETSALEKARSELSG